MKKGLLWAWLCALAFTGFSQDYELKSTVDIYKQVQELERGLRVLYIAAHPDDENTRLISWLENDQHVETAYLSLTRGQGGQNLIGDEKGDALGVIRTYELLEARKVDGGQQFFTRAIDFGYSKSAEESFAFWGREEILHDVVYVIRKYRPHVIITRFPSSSYAGHGHHEASALLAEEAFELAADKSAFPDQFNSVKPWSPEVLYHNTSSWWDESLEDMSDEELRAKKMHKVNVGVYNDLLGMGMNEIASIARSKHRCQAFGTPRSRGEQTEFLQFVKGEWSAHFLDSLRGVWEISPQHAQALQTMLDEFNFTSRTDILRSLQTHFYPKMAQRNIWADPIDIAEVMEAVEQLKLDLSGLRVEVYAGEDPVVITTEYPVTVEVYNSSDKERQIQFKHDRIDTSVTVQAGERLSWEETLVAPSKPSNPFWLQKEHEGWLYGMEKPDIGVPVKKAEMIPYIITIEGQMIRSETELHRRWNDRSIGEIQEAMAFVNPFTVNPKVGSLVMKKGTSKTIEVEVKANYELGGAQFQLDLPDRGWVVKYDQEMFQIKKGQVKTFELEVVAGEEAEADEIRFLIPLSGYQCDQKVTEIDYEHIPYTLVHDLSVTKVIPLELNNDTSKQILYIDGSGDEVDDALALMGYKVDHRSLNGITRADLESYDAVVTGIRAFNRNEELASNLDLLLEYVENGGNMIVQYTTTYDLQVEQIGPYPLTLSRNRVTDETSEVKLLKKRHDIFKTPNEITDADWEGWVQERGLYFAGEWDKAYTPLISWHDKDEEAVEGGLLVAAHGEGAFIYTGISFFRQLPAGVPGAYRLLANLIEYQP